MSTLLRLALLVSAAGLVVMLFYSPRRIQRFGRRARMVGYVYVAAILIGAVLRLLGFYGT